MVTCRLVRGSPLGATCTARTRNKEVVCRDGRHRAVRGHRDGPGPLVTESVPGVTAGEVQSGQPAAQDSRIDGGTAQSAMSEGGTGADGGLSAAVASVLGQDAASVIDVPPDQRSNSFFATVKVAEHPNLTLPGNGDLWPSCWSDDGQLYAAWGDGWGFDSEKQTFADIGVAQISGSPRDGSLSGLNLAVGDAVGQVWTAGDYTRKPTGIVCVGGDLYLAVQDLGKTFDEAPTATVAKSTDKGRTWEWNRSTPMFRDHELTTIFFLDFGKDGAHAIDTFVYAYALDGNWRDSLSHLVADPTRMYLARVPRDALQDRQRWEWYAGQDQQGAAQWETDPKQREPVLEDDRRVYVHTTSDLGKNVSNLSVISQGGVTYDAPLGRYLYTSWTEYTYEFYEAPTPWGPFRLFLSKDFGAYPWADQKVGGYGATIPSKFISEDGLSMQVQSNTFWGGVQNYSFSLRELSLAPFTPSGPTNRPGEPIPLSSDGAVPIGSSFHFGHPEMLSDGVTAGQSEDSRTGESRAEDFWGYTWPREYSFNRVSYTTGQVSNDCGWFDSLVVEVRRGGVWSPVDLRVVSPQYVAGSSVGMYQTFTFDFLLAVGDGARIAGRPGGNSCTSISELSVGYE